MKPTSEQQQWKRQRVHKANAIPTQQQILNLAKSTYAVDPMEKTLFLMTYLSAGRISEVVKKNFLYVNVYMKKGKKVIKNQNGSPIILERKKTPLNYEGIKTSDISFEEISGKKVMVLRVQNRKNKQFKTKNIPIPMEREEEFLNEMKGYLESLHDNEPLFNFTISKAQRIINKSGYNCHFLRDIRLTHMVTMYNFNAFQLVKYAGWKNIQPAERYVRLGVNDLVVNY